MPENVKSNTTNREVSFGAMDPDLLPPVDQSQTPEELCRLPNGHILFRTPNKVGGYIYASDEVGGGVVVWDTCLVDESTLLAALTEEARRIREEYRSKQSG